MHSNQHMGGELVSLNVGDISLGLKVDGQSIDTQIKDAGKKSGGLFSSIFSSNATSGVSSSIGLIKSSLLGLGGAVATGGGLFALADSAVTAGDNVYELSQKMHLSTDEASQMNRMLQMSNTDTGSFISTMTRLDKGIESAGSKGNATTNALKGFGISLTDSSGKLLPMNQQLAALAAGYQKASAAGDEESFSATVLGTKGLALTGILSDYNDVADAASKVKGVGIDPKLAHEVSIEMQSLKGQVSQFGYTAGSAVMPIVQKMIPPLLSGLSNVASMIKNHQPDIQKFASNIAEIGKTVLNIVLPPLKTVIGFITQHGEAVKNIVLGVAGAFVAWKTITLGMKVAQEGQNAVMLISALCTGGVAAATDAMEGATGSATVAQWLLNAAMSANPVGLIIIAIAALIAIVLLVVTHWKQVTKFFQGLWKDIVGIFTGLWKDVVGVFTDFWKWIQDFFGKWGTTIIAILCPFIGIPLLIAQHWKEIIKFFEKLWTTIVQGIKTFISNVGSFFMQLPGKIGFALGYAIGTIIKWGIDIVKWATTAIPKFLSTVGTFFLDLPGNIWNTLVSASKKFNDFEWEIIDWAGKAIPKFLATIGTALFDLPGNIWNLLVSALDKFNDFEGKIIDWAEKEIPKIITNILKFFLALPGDLLNIGKDIVNGLWNGISGVWKTVTDGVKNLTGGLVSGIKSALGIHSPSTIFAAIGGFISKGLANGITGGKNLVSNALQSLVPTNPLNINSQLSFGGTTPNLSLAGQGGGGNINNNSYSYGPGQCVFPIYVDGKFSEKVVLTAAQLSKLEINRNIGMGAVSA